MEWNGVERRHDGGTLAVLAQTVQDIRTDVHDIKENVDKKLDTLQMSMTELRMSVQEGDMGLSAKLQIHAAAPDSHRETVTRVDNLERRVRDLEDQQTSSAARRNVADQQSERRYLRWGIIAAVIVGIWGFVGQMLGSLIQAAATVLDYLLKKGGS